jgi:hypothetical protein
VGFEDGGRSENDIAKYRRISSPTAVSDRKTRGAFWGARSPSAAVCGIPKRNVAISFTKPETA